MKEETFSSPIPLREVIALLSTSLASLRTLTLLSVATLAFTDLSWAEPGLSCECPINMQKLEPCLKPTCPGSETYTSDTECVSWAKTATASKSITVSCTPIIKNSLVTSCTMAGDPVTLKKCEIRDDRCALIDVLVIGACKKMPGRDGWTVSRGCTEEFVPYGDVSESENSQDKLCPGQCSAQLVTWKSSCLTPVEGTEVKRASCEAQRVFRSGPPIPVGPPPKPGESRGAPAA